MKTNGLSCSHSHSMAKAFKASAAEGWCSQLSSTASTPVSSSSCCVAGLGHGPRRYQGRSWAVACLTTLYDIAISRYTGLRYRDTIFSHDTSPTFLRVLMSEYQQLEVHLLCMSTNSIQIMFILWLSQLWQHITGKPQFPRLFPDQCQIPGLSQVFPGMWPPC